MSGSANDARHLAIVLPGPAGALEALLQVQGEGDPQVAALVCHPHPLYGGTMHNKVVHRVASVLAARGVAVLRFNFRGVGQSEGTHNRGIGELEDARAAFHGLRERFPAARLWCAGFSFGSWIAARLAAAEPATERLILVAPPVTRSGFQVLRSSTVPKLVIQGTGDEVCRSEALMSEFPTWAEPKRLIMVEGASHFFDRQLAALGEALVEGLFSTPEPRTSEST